MVKITVSFVNVTCGDYEFPELSAAVERNGVIPRIGEDIHLPMTGTVAIDVATGEKAMCTMQGGFFVEHVSHEPLSGDILIQVNCSDAQARGAFELQPIPEDNE